MISFALLVLYVSAKNKTDVIKRLKEITTLMHHVEPKNPSEISKNNAQNHTYFLTNWAPSFYRDKKTLRLFFELRHARQNIVCSQTRALHVSPMLRPHFTHVLIEHPQMGQDMDLIYDLSDQSSFSSLRDFKESLFENCILDTRTGKISSFQEFLSCIQPQPPKSQPPKPQEQE